MAILQEVKKSYTSAMKTRQIKKIMDLYLFDEDEDLLIPPSVYRYEDREMEKYYSKAWRISNPKQAAEMDKAIEEAIAQAQKKASEN